MNLTLYKSFAVVVLCLVTYTNLFSQKALDYGYGIADAPVAKICTQKWSVKNLNVNHFRNGDPIPEAKTKEEWQSANNNKQPAWCYTNNDPANGQIHGKLYNWYAVNDPRGLAPAGWHVPSYDEWMQMINYLGGEATAGSSLKATSGWGWPSSAGGTNRIGFTGLPSGSRGGDGAFSGLGGGADYWSSSKSDAGGAWGFGLYPFSGRVAQGRYRENCGFPVRCLRD